jgi:class 3 adenylate cyclase
MVGGATVNAAARMESSGPPSRIHLAASIRERLDHGLECEERTIDVKGLGSMTTYLLAEA